MRVVMQIQRLRSRDSVATGDNSLELAHGNEIEHDRACRLGSSKADGVLS
jgi:hypothetical protein